MRPLRFECHTTPSTHAPSYVHEFVTQHFVRFTGPETLIQKEKKKMALKVCHEQKKYVLKSFKEVINASSEVALRVELRPNKI